jgi:Ca2+-binding RTX toxin-like protein
MGGAGDDVLAPGNDRGISPTDAIGAVKSTPDGNDTVSGGDGFDSVLYLGRSDNLTLDANGTPTSGDVAAGEADQIDTDVEFVFGGYGNDTIGAAADATFKWAAGGAGADSLSGGLGDDTLVGGPGPDTVNGNAGNDYYFLNDSPPSADQYVLGPGLDFANTDTLDLQVS